MCTGYATASPLMLVNRNGANDTTCQCQWYLEYTGTTGMHNSNWKFGSQTLFTLVLNFTQFYVEKPPAPHQDGCLSQWWPPAPLHQVFPCIYTQRDQGFGYPSPANSFCNNLPFNISIGSVASIYMNVYKRIFCSMYWLYPIPHVSTTMMLS